MARIFLVSFERGGGPEENDKSSQPCEMCKVTKGENAKSSQRGRDLLCVCASNRFHSRHLGFEAKEVHGWLLSHNDFVPRSGR